MITNASPESRRRRWTQPAIRTVAPGRSTYDGKLRSQGARETQRMRGRGRWFSHETSRVGCPGGVGDGQFRGATTPSPIWSDQPSLRSSRCGGSGVSSASGRSPPSQLPAALWAALTDDYSSPSMPQLSYPFPPVVRSTTGGSVRSVSRISPARGRTNPVESVAWQAGVHVRSLCLEPQARGPRRGVRRRPGRCRRAAGARLQRGTDQGHLRGLRPDAARCGRRGRTPASARVGVLGTGPVLGQGPVDRLADDQRPGRDAGGRSRRSSGPSACGAAFCRPTATSSGTRRHS